eukprot:3565958-Rhodomonas_salina.4
MLMTDDDGRTMDAGRWIPRRRSASSPSRTAKPRSRRTPRWTRPSACRCSAIVDCFVRTASIRCPRCQPLVVGAALICDASYAEKSFHSYRKQRLTLTTRSLLLRQIPKSFRKGRDCPGH